VGAAKDGRGRKRCSIAFREKALRDLNQVINGATGDLAELVERYTRLSLSGSFSAQVGSAVRLLEQHCTALEKKGVDQDQLQKVKESLDHMKRKLELLNNAKEKARKQSVGIGHSSRSFLACYNSRCTSSKFSPCTLQLNLILCDILMTYMHGDRGPHMYK
jgi:hypothetical protein